LRSNWTTAASTTATSERYPWRSGRYWKHFSAGSPPLAHSVGYILKFPRTSDDELEDHWRSALRAVPGRCRSPLDWRSPRDLSPIIGRDSARRVLASSLLAPGVRVDIDELRISRAAVVTVAQAASVFGVDVRTVTRAIENGELPALRLGRRVLIPRLPLLVVLGVRVEDALTQAHDAGSDDR
jgi:excisionase family DNA binding protein